MAREPNYAPGPGLQGGAGDGLAELQDEPDRVALAQQLRAGERIAVDDDEVGEAARLDRAHGVVEAEREGGARGRGDERLVRGQPLLDHAQQLDAEVLDRGPVVPRGDPDARGLGRAQRQAGLLDVVAGELAEQL